MRSVIWYQIIRWSIASISGVLIMGLSVLVAWFCYRLLMAMPHWVLPWFTFGSLTLAALAALFGGLRRAGLARRKRGAFPADGATT